MTSWSDAHNFPRIGKVAFAVFNNKDNDFKRRINE
jgi:hypothetical protein